jgi:hypothetical protein
MKLSYAFLFIILFHAMFSLQQCKEDPSPLTELEKLPPATQSGKYTFGCLVDGKAWVPEGYTGAVADYQLGALSIFTGLDNDDFSSLIQLHVDEVNLQETTYELKEPTLNSDHARYYDYVASCEFFTSNTNPGQITITHLDKINYIISGTFEFEAYSADCARTVKITNGRFDIYYAP